VFSLEAEFFWLPKEKEGILLLCLPYITFHIRYPLQKRDKDASIQPKDKLLSLYKQLGPSYKTKFFGFSAYKKTSSMPKGQD